MTSVTVTDLFIVKNSLRQDRKVDLILNVYHQIMKHTQNSECYNTER